MDWILDNIWVLIAIASVIARIVMKRKQAEAGETTQPPSKEYEFEDPELAERTRKIREEIQRKIAERRGQHTLPPVIQPTPTSPVRLERSPEATTPPVALPEIIREVLQPKAQSLPQGSRRAPFANTAEELERQAALREKLEEARLMKEAALKRAAFEASIADKEPVVLQKAREGVLDDLRDPLALRRAFVLREVLGPPVALR